VPSIPRYGRRALRVSGTLLVAGLVAAPSLALVKETLPYRVPVFPAPMVGVPAAALRLLPIPAWHGAIPVLAYRDVSMRHGRYTVTPRQLAMHLAVLRAGGFHSVSVGQVRAFLSGVPARLPPRPILLIFTGGLATHWTTVTPILHAYGFRGVAFVPTGSIARRSPSYYLTEDEIRAMARSGSWEFGAETHDGTGTVTTRGGRTGPWLTVPALRPDGTLESPAGWRDRVTGDLDRSRDVLARLVDHPVEAFVYPPQPARHAARDPGIARELDVVLAERFALAFDTVPGTEGVATPITSRFHIPAIAVTAANSGPSLLRELRRAVPAPLPEDMASSSWRTRGGTSVRTGRAALTLTTRRYARSSLDQNTSLWTDYRLQVRIRGASRNATALLAVRSSRAGAVEVLVGESRIRVRQAVGKRRTPPSDFPFRAPRSRRSGARSPTRLLDLDLLGDLLILRLDHRAAGSVLLDRRLWSGGIELGLSARDRQSVTFADLRVNAVKQGRPGVLRP
jgi:Polysaccharide deacetylase